MYHVRSKVADSPTFYNLSLEKVLEVWYNLETPADYFLSEMAPHDRGTLQGELSFVDGNWYLYYNTEQMPMRDGFKKAPKHARGIMVSSLLHTYLCPNSQEWIAILQERYPWHTIEFSSFSCNWGTLPHFNTVVWEVRKY